MILVELIANDFKLIAIGPALLLLFVYSQSLFFVIVSIVYVSATEITALRDQLSKKDEQMKEMEDRYKNYLDKAKSVIKTFDPKQAPPAASEGNQQEVQFPYKNLFFVTE